MFYIPGTDLIVNDASFPDAGYTTSTACRTRNSSNAHDNLALQYFIEEYIVFING